MADAKIEFKFGTIYFVGEGDKEWVTKQLDKVIEHLPSLAKLAPPEADLESDSKDKAASHRSTVKALGVFLKEKSVSSNQTKKFLATSIWLHEKGQKRLTTAEVSKALNDNQQGKLSNPAQCLNTNVSQGYCTKDGKAFYVTPEGYKNV
jgi:hypothetical protein